MVTDPGDISRVKFTAGRYDSASLDELYNGNEHVLNYRQCFEQVSEDIDSLWIGSVFPKNHARYWPNVNSYEFRRSSYSDMKTNLRETKSNRLVRKDIHFIFTVDLYNEGVDIKQVNTVLFLRPTDSMTVFIQQLGRGLRTCENKTELTVLDFVGQANNKYRMNEQKIRYLTSMVAAPVAMQFEK